jgi:hypothetical protein
MPVKYAAQKRNSTLIQFDELKDAVIANVVKDVPEAKKEKKQEQNKSLSDF